MNLKFQKISQFHRGFLFKLLSDAYSFNNRWKYKFEKDWLSFDQFFFDNPSIADKYGFITTLNEHPIGLVSWDPRNRPAYVEVGHNCIISTYKGHGYGKIQLQEAIHRIITDIHPQRIIVTTNATLIPAQHMYESVGFEFVQKRENLDSPFSGDYLDYCLNI